MHVTAAVQTFLHCQAGTHNGPDLLARWSPAMETQVNVSPGDGQRVDGTGGTFTDGVRTWWNIRIPKHAATSPEWTDYELTWPLELHAHAVGSTGWDWVNRRSRWVGFDFDAIAGHAPGVGIESDELARVAAAARALPWVEVRKSTRGAGLHLYVLVDVPTANHTEHAALARAVLAKMSAATGFDFAPQVDACGGNLWIWHRDATPVNGGLSLVKPAERSLTADELDGWQAHVDVVKRKRVKVALHPDAEKLAASRKPVELEPEHLATIEALESRGVVARWVQDHHLLQTHTAGLAMLAHRGIFRTLSAGENLSEPNCFAFPLDGGAWRVFRFGAGTVEAPTWQQDGQGWTQTTYNAPPDLRTAAVAYGGVERPETVGGFEFADGASARDAIAALGHDMELPDEWVARRAVLKAAKDGRLVVEIQRDKSEAAPPGWLPRKGNFTRLVDVATSPADTWGADDLVRVLVTPQGGDAGVYVRSACGTWDAHTLGHAKLALQAAGHDKSAAEVLLGQAIVDRWERVSLPFQPEYPGGRQWNQGAAQLAVEPADRDAELETRYWDLVLGHIGQSLDEPLAALAWARAARVHNGRDYLRAWIACLLREPFAPLPYLCLFGPENSGKSLLWEAIALLVTRGVVKADRALTNQSDFNGELLGAVLCVVEEKDISKAPGALNKIKDYVTALTLSIRKMRTDSFDVPNTTHWIQCANDETFCPVFPGDTRITMIHVPRPAADIPKPRLLDELKAEAPAFLRQLLDLELPPQLGRLRLPIVTTRDKQEAADRTAPLAVFLRECCQLDPDARTPKAELFAAWQAWCAEHGEPAGDNQRFGLELARLTDRKVSSVRIRAGEHFKAGYAGVALAQP